MTNGPSFTAVLVALVIVVSGARWRPTRHRRPDDDRDGAARGRRDRGGRSRPNRTKRSLDRDAATVLEHIGREVRSGTSLSVATASTLRSEPDVLVDLRHALTRGTPLTAAIGATAATSSTETVMLQALRTAATVGGPMADTLDRGARILHERQAWADERLAQAAQARLSAMVLTFVPLGFAALGIVSSSRVRTAYTEVPIALPITATGVLLNAAGWWWMRRLVDGTAR